jgi:hypothetical protein
MAQHQTHFRRSAFERTGMVIAMGHTTVALSLIVGVAIALVAVSPYIAGAVLIIGWPS